MAKQKLFSHLAILLLYGYSSAASLYRTNRIEFARARPNHDAHILFAVEPSTTVSSVREENGWLQIESPEDPKIFGWVRRSDLSSLAPDKDEIADNVARQNIPESGDSLTVKITQSLPEKAATPRANPYLIVVIAGIMMLSTVRVVYVVTRKAINEADNVESPPKAIGVEVDNHGPISHFEIERLLLSYESFSRRHKRVVLHGSPDDILCSTHLEVAFSLMGEFAEMVKKLTEQQEYLYDKINRLKQKG